MGYLNADVFWHMPSNEYEIHVSGSLEHKPIELGKFYRNKLLQVLCSLFYSKKTSVSVQGIESLGGNEQTKRGRRHVYGKQVGIISRKRKYEVALF